MKSTYLIAIIVIVYGVLFSLLFVSAIARDGSRDIGITSKPLFKDIYPGNVVYGVGAGTIRYMGVQNNEIVFNEQGVMFSPDFTYRFAYKEDMTIRIEGYKVLVFKNVTVDYTTQRLRYYD